MPFEAEIFRILVASPGDTGEEREVIPEVINEWNAIYAYSNNKVLMPIKWETHSSPLLGDRPQSIINEQVVKNCDLLVGLFWTRIGTQTGVSISGTAEEIEQFVDSKKPVMLYFSQTPIDPDRIEIDQFTELKKFKETMRLKGLTESYSGIPDFRQKFTRQLGINLNNLFEPIAESHASSTKKEIKTGNTLKEIGLPESELSSLTTEDARAYLLRALNTTAKEDGRANLSSFAHYLHTYTPLNYKKLGYEKLKDYLDSTKLFEFESISPTHVLIKSAPKAQENL